MTDREMLEFAAKAAGVDFISERSTDQMLWIVGGGVWSPKHDDGDALRLAVKLELSILLRPYRVEVISWPQTTDVLGFGIPPTPRVIAIEPYGDDPQVATRYAIFRVAAEIGKGLT